MSGFNTVFTSLPTTIFEVMSVLAREHQAVNLGQGFPDDPGPEDVRRAAAEAAVNGDNQYPSMMGLPELREAVAGYYNRRDALGVDPAQVVVTCGATEALAASILALIQPGDEVVMFQPLYDSYAPVVRLAGGVPKFISLSPPHWRITEDLLSQAISDSTKLIIFNNPLNPAAVVHGLDELSAIARACVRHDVIAICDEVWEEVLLDGRAFTPLFALPGMAERCVKIGSAGKMFSLTGWKIGWTIAAPRLTAAIAKAHQFLTFTIAPPLQRAVAYGLTHDGSGFEAMRAGFQRSHDRLAAGLTKAGYAVAKAQGTYFLNIDLTRSGLDLDDRRFALKAVKEFGVASIPVSAFYDRDPVTTTVRLCFAKRDETLDAGIERLARLRDRLTR